MNGLEEWGNWEHVVLNNLAVVVDKVKNLCLSATRTMNHTVNVGTKFVKQTLDNWSVGTCRRKYQLTGINAYTLNGICKFVFSAIDKLVGYIVVETFGIFLSKILGKDIMSCTCQTIGTHTAIVFLLVCSLAGRTKTHDNVSRTDVCIVNDILSPHPAGYSRVNNNGAY